MTMEGKLHQVTPFGYPRVLARLQLSEAFRSLLRPSSPVGTKAFTISPSVPHIEESPGDPQLKSFRVRISLFVCLILVCLSLVWKLYFSHKIWLELHSLALLLANAPTFFCYADVNLPGCCPPALSVRLQGSVLRTERKRVSPVPERASGSGA